MLTIKVRLAPEYIRKDDFADDDKNILGLVLKDQSLPEEPRYKSYMALDENTCRSLKLPFGLALLERWLFEITLVAKTLPLCVDGYWKGKPNIRRMERDDLFIREIERNDRIFYNNWVDERGTRKNSTHILRVSTNNADDTRLIPEDRMCPQYNFVAGISAEEYQQLTGMLAEPIVFQAHIRSCNPAYKT